MIARYWVGWVRWIQLMFRSTIHISVDGGETPLCGRGNISILIYNTDRNDGFTREELERFIAKLGTIDGPHVCEMCLAVYNNPAKVASKILACRLDGAT